MEGVSVNTDLWLLLSLFFSLQMEVSVGLSEVVVLREEQLCPDDPQRLKQHHLLCGAALTGPCNWEVEWRGELHPAVTENHNKWRWLSVLQSELLWDQLLCVGVNTVSADTLRLLHSSCCTLNHLLHLEPGLFAFIHSHILNPNCLYRWGRFMTSSLETNTSLVEYFSFDFSCSSTLWNDGVVQLMSTYSEVTEEVLVVTNFTLRFSYYNE